MKIAILNEGFKQKVNTTLSYIKDLEPYFNIKNVDLMCGRNDSIAFQLGVVCNHDAALAISGQTLFNLNDNCVDYRISCTLDNKDIKIKLYHQELMMDETGCYYADVLHQTPYCYVKKDFPQMIWVDLFIPDSVEKGIYKGKISVFKHRIFENEEKIYEIDINLNVKNVLLPYNKDNGFYLDLWQHNSNIARKHEVALWSDNHFTIVEKYIKSLADLGQKAITIIASEIPWSGQFGFEDKIHKPDFYEYNIILVKKQDGKFIYDYSVMKRYIDLCFKYGIKDEIEIFGLSNIWCFESEGFGKVADDYPDAIRIRYFDNSDNTYKYMQKASEIKDYIKSLINYLDENNLLNITVISADEPSDVNSFRSSLKVLKETVPNVKFKTAINHIEFIEEFKDDLTHIVPMLHFVSEKFDFIKELKKDFHGKIYWYVCCYPKYPNTYLNSPLAEARFIPILNHFMGLDGFLRWNYTVWPNNPRKDIRAKQWNAGETNFVYPSYGGEPILTPRYMALKRGISDFWLLNQAKEICPDILQKVYDIIIKNKDITQYYLPGTNPQDLYSVDYNDYITAKNILLEALEN